jgi:hypothetical protein
MPAEVRRCQVRQVDGRFSFCDNEVVALACVLETGQARATCWPHLAKVLRQMLADYQTRDFGIRFVTRQDEPLAGISRPAGPPATWPGRNTPRSGHDHRD